VALDMAMPAYSLIAGRQDPIASAAATNNPQTDSVHSRVLSRYGLGRKPVVTSPVTGTGLIGLVCRQVGSKVATRP
jgi:hypothetical protein